MIQFIDQRPLLRPLDTSRIANPRAPRLNDPRFADRAAPQQLVAIGKKKRCKWYFDAPRECLLSFVPGKRETGTPCLVRADGVTRLATPPLTWPWPHAFTAEGEWLVLGTVKGAWRVHLPSLEATECPPTPQVGGASLLLAVAGHVAAYAGPSTSTELVLFDLRQGEEVGRVPVEHPTFLGSGCQGRLLAVHSHAGTVFYEVEGSEVREVHRDPAWVTALWDEGGRTFVNIVVDHEGIDDPRLTQDETQLTYELVRSVGTVDGS